MTRIILTEKKRIWKEYENNEVLFPGLEYALVHKTHRFFITNFGAKNDAYILILEIY